jgi:hypothetical protein
MKAEIILTRLTDNGKQTTGILSYLSFAGIKIFSTLEPAWLNNRINESCIPAGKYIVESYYSSKYGRCLAVKDVIGRTRIRFHYGNYRKNSKGCILVGEKFEHINKDKLIDITNSRESFKYFMNFINDNEQIGLIISDTYKVYKT